MAQTVLVVGDSLSAAHNLPIDAGWVSLLQVQLRKQSKQAVVHNASISGETSAGGAERIDELLATYRPEILLIELGANDSLRGLSLTQTRANLQYMLQAGRESGARILLIGIELPVNYGRRYREGLRQMYAELAQQFADGFVPHLLEALGSGTEQFQPDGLHPNEQAQAAILQTVMRAWPQPEAR